MVSRYLEKRRSPRHYTRRDAKVIVTGRPQPVDCVLHDISDTGARLSFGAPSNRLPRTFTLLFFKDSSLKRDCKVMWTAGSFAGVRFVSPWYSTPRKGPMPMPAAESVRYA
jgi:hypothetical protein